MQSPSEASEKPVPEALPANGAPFCPQSSRRFVLIAAILASALGFIDGSMLAIAMPAIRVDLGASLAEAQWISNAYALTLSALILAGGAAGDRFGLRHTFVAGIALFVRRVAGLRDGARPGDADRVPRHPGIGAAIMVPGSLAIIAKAYPKKERGRAIGIWAAASALTTALGPVLGGLVLAAFGDGIWRAIFAINLPLGADLDLSAVGQDSRRRADRKAQRSISAARRSATLAFGALAYGLTVDECRGRGRICPGPSIAAGVVLLVVFILWERRQREPMIDLGLFRSGAFAGANVATFFLYFALSANLFYLPMLLIAGWGLSTAEVGFIFLPLSACDRASVGADRPVVRPDRPALPDRQPAACSWPSPLPAWPLLTHAGIHHFWTGAFPLMTLMGLGMALVVSPLSTAIMTAVEDKDTGAASGINNAVSRIAGLIAVAAMGSRCGLGLCERAGTERRRRHSRLRRAGTGRTCRQQLDAARLAASDAAFAAVALITAVLCLLVGGHCLGDGFRQQPAVVAGTFREVDG